MRRLAAVWFADVVGYTHLATKDEDAALAVVDELQGLSRRAAEGRGRIVKFMGDGVLATFDSTSNALLAAVDLEERFAASEVVKRHGCSLSVGVHLGEVVEAEDGDVYGDGVNVASRIEGLAGGGEILISEDVYRQVRNRSTFQTRPFGKHQPKGLESPIALYALAAARREALATRRNEHAGHEGGSDVAPSSGGPARTTWQPLPLSTVLKNRYVVDAMLGRGAFGATYRAFDRGRFDAVCAVKEFAPVAGPDEAGVVRFEREAQSLVALRHDGIPRLHEFFAERGRYFLVQDLAEGTDLATRVADRGPFDEEETAAVLAQLLDILGYLHGRDPPVVHRDVKPANVILSDDGRVQLVDFGAVRDARPDAGTVSAIFTPGYAPMKQLLGKVTPSADLFAAGATAAYLLTATPPERFYDVETDSLEVRGRTGASATLEAVIEKLTRGHYATASEARRDLDASYETLREEHAEPRTDGRTTMVLPTGGAALDGEEMSPVDLGTRPDTGGRTGGRRGSRGVRVSIAAAMVAGIALTVTFLSEPAAEEDTTEAASEPALTVDEGATSPQTVAGSARAAEGAGAAGASILDATARAATDADLLIQIAHPATWPIVSQPTDDHVAVRDPSSGAIFLAGIDVMQGLDIPARVFVERWSATTAATYANVAVVSARPAAGSSVAFRLDVTQGSQAVREGVAFVTPLTEVESGRTLFRWWAALNQDDGVAATLEAMAQSTEVLLDENAM